ncbi:Histidine kinase [Variovorax sp. HW608]|uniref:sensor histidine kinase n=1 Tax=Variovorax sp. HW608 TaxID=1034889 RepID=UPI00081F92C0|nr:histidine kinase [Variovorax sp. HW608]SCK30616.1 Histidine kinase [Variovorax sp. HW608]
MKEAVEIEADAGAAADVADARMIARMRLVLATSAFLALFVHQTGQDDIYLDVGTRAVTSFYFCYSLVICALTEFFRFPWQRTKWVHWLDVFWYGLFLMPASGIHGFYFLFFFLAILTSSFRWGFEEGARVTVASIVLLAMSGIVHATEPEYSRLLMRATFLLALGYMSVYWGGSRLELRRRMELLRDVSRVSNPRFGVDHTVTQILEKTVHFFSGSSCILVLRDKHNGSYSMRIIKAGSSGQSLRAVPITIEAASPLMGVDENLVVAYSSPSWWRPVWLRKAGTYNIQSRRWTRSNDSACQMLAELLEARSFISAPLSVRQGHGRIYLLSSDHDLSRSDAMFFNYVGAQVFPVIGTIELLDSMASGAALRERQKFALDLHDTAIQPYIGLKLALSALRKKAAQDNPLNDDLDKIAAQATKVVSDLRRFAGTVRDGAHETEQMIVSTLKQQAANMRDFYGIEIDVQVEGKLGFADRLAAEVLNVVREGMSNICRHTFAQRGAVRLHCAEDCVRILIENEAGNSVSMNFVPRSICERAAALGGRAHVCRGLGGSTEVHVEIPI